MENTKASVWIPNLLSMDLVHYWNAGWTPDLAVNP